MRFVAAAIVLAFPVLDLLATARFARWSTVPVWAWVAGGLVAGIALLRSEGLAFRSRTVAAMHGDVSLLRGLLDSGYADCPDVPYTRRRHLLEQLLSFYHRHLDTMTEIRSVEVLKEVLR